MEQITESGVRVERRQQVTIVTLDNSRRRNAMGRRIRQQFRDAVGQALQADDECRAVVVTGAGGHFSAGADISEMGERTITRSREIIAESCEVIRYMTGGRKPVVAAVEGVCFGMGFSIAAAADFVIASREARFCAAFMRVGLVPDTGILWSLPQRVGPAKARELLALATEIDAAEAERIGVADRLVEPGRAVDEAVEFAGELAGHPQLTVALIKAALTRGSDTLDDALNTEVDYQAILSSSAPGGQRGSGHG